MTETLSREDAKAFYDRFGAKQDSQGFYEDRALADLIEHSDFETARHIFEFGCGTGRFAERILKSHLPASGQYDGVDISTTMVALAGRRIAQFGARARVSEVGGGDVFSALNGTVDRLVSTYVLDLLSEAEISVFMINAGELLVPNGKLCLVSLTTGTGLVSRAITEGWKMLFKLSPRLVGGCRPIRLRDCLPEAGWHLSHHATISSFGITSEVMVVDRLASTHAHQ